MFFGDGPIHEAVYQVHRDHSQSLLSRLSSEIAMYLYGNAPNTAVYQPVDCAIL